MDIALKRSGLLVEKIENETIILDSTGGLSHSLNQTAAFIWDRLDEDSNVETISESLAHHFDVDFKTALSDVNKALKSFKELSLLS